MEEDTEMVFTLTDWFVWLQWIIIMIIYIIIFKIVVRKYNGIIHSTALVAFILSDVWWLVLEGFDHITIVFTVCS